MQKWFLLLIAVALLGAFCFHKTVEGLEGMYTNNKSNNCPNLLIKKGAKFLLYNTKLASVPGVNPTEFENLSDYVLFLQWNRSVGIRCPVLYLEQTYDAQGKRVYKARPSVEEPQQGLPPTGAVPMGAVPAADTTDLYDSNPMEIKPVEPVEPTAGCSLSAMDPNWCGLEATQAAVDAGVFAGNSRDPNEIE